jgi:hypothetical protein
MNHNTYKLQITPTGWRQPKASKLPLSSQQPHNKQQGKAMLLLAARTRSPRTNQMSVSPMMVDGQMELTSSVKPLRHRAKR